MTGNVEAIAEAFLSVMRVAGQPIPSVWICNRASKRLGWEVAPAYVQAWLGSSGLVQRGNDPILGEVFSLV